MTFPALLNAGLTLAHPGQALRIATGSQSRIAPMGDMPLRGVADRGAMEALRADRSRGRARARLGQEFAHGE